MLSSISLYYLWGYTYIHYTEISKCEGGIIPKVILFSTRKCQSALWHFLVLKSYLLLFHWSDLQMQFFQLLLIDGGWRIHEQVDGALRLGESNHFANALLVGQQHNKTIDAKSNAAVGRRAVLEGFEHVAELLLDLLIIHVHER